MQNETLNKIREFADTAHGSQLRKYTHEPYIVHPVRVMQMTAAYNNQLSMLAAALLHDVLEDTETSPQEILSFLHECMEVEQAQHSLHLVEELTDVYEKKNYPQWNRKKRKSMEAERLGQVSSEAQTIKYADIIDNSREIMEYDPGFGFKFSQECRMILSKMKRGDPELRQRAMDTVEANLEKVN